MDVDTDHKSIKKTSGRRHRSQEYKENKWTQTQTQEYTGIKKTSGRRHWRKKNFKSNPPYHEVTRPNKYNHYEDDAEYEFGGSSAAQYFN